MNILGIDYGSKNIGVAIAYEENNRFLVVGYETFTKSKNLIRELEEIIRKESIEEIVVGVPIGLKGQRTQQTEETLMFIHMLRSELSLPVAEEDERLTSALAKKISKEDIHQESAKIILRGYVEKMRRGE